MNIKEQVLNVEQVQELRELGFDFRKYSSACVIEAKDRNKYIVDRRLIGLHIGFMETEVIEYHETMTIGDIIEVLPGDIHKKYSLEIGKNYVEYCCDHVAINGYVEFKLIDALFEMLKWCIKEKHMELKQTNLENRFFSEEEFNRILCKAINAMEKYNK